jgi:fructokinase
MRIGVDLGGTKIEGIALADDGTVTKKIRVDTPADNYTDTVRAVCDVVEQLQQSEKLTVGIGTPGTLALPEEIMKNSNSVCLNGHPLKKDIEAILGYQVRIENDANCFVLSEAHYGAAKEVKTVFGVILGTGCGGGVVVDKKLLAGPNSIAGEWGHNTIPVSVHELIEDDRICHCGRVNCIETVLSGRGLQQSYLEQTGKEASAKSIAEQAQANDSDAKDCLNRYAKQLARCLSTIINVLDPHMIVFGGGLSNISALYELVPQELNGHVFTDEIKTIIAKPSFGDASGALGAACLWDVN